MSTNESIGFARLTRLTANNFGAFFAMIDFDGRLLHFDSSKANLLGLDWKKIEGGHVNESLFPSLEKEEWPLDCRRDQQQFFPRTEHYAEANRHVFWEAEFDEENQTVLLLGTAVDVENHAVSEFDQLTERLRRHDRLLGNLPGIVYRCRIDRNWTMEFVSEGAQDLCGYSKQQLLSGELSWGDQIILESDRQYVWNVVMEALSNREPFMLYYQIKTCDGKIRTVWERGMGVFNQNDEPIALEGFITDMTPLVQTQVALREAKERAEASNRAKDEFLAVISHEMRTPLNPILGFTTMLLEENLSSDSREALEIIQRSANKLLRQIEDILEFIGIDKHKTRIEPRPICLWDFTRELASDLHPLRNRNEFEVVNGCEAFPEFAPELCVSLDPNLTGQVISNLVHNAFKFTLQGKVQLRVGWRPTSSGGKVRFEVIDNGIGIAPEQHDVVFEPFTQVESNYTRRYEGVGLGLAICSKLVDVLGGSIDFESEPGEGSRFWFDIPAGPVAAIHEEDEEDDQLHRTFANTRILVVEDNEDNRHMLVELLRKLGADVMTANDGATAIERCRQYDFHYVLMDISMPEVDGFEASQRILEISESAPKIIAVTAHASKDVKQRCLDSGMVEYLSKPVTFHALQSMLQQLHGVG